MKSKITHISFEHTIWGYFQTHSPLVLDRDDIIDDRALDGETEGLLCPKALDDGWPFDLSITKIETTTKNNDHLKISMFQGVKKKHSTSVFDWKVSFYILHKT